MLQMIFQNDDDLMSNEIYDYYNDYYSYQKYIPISSTVNKNHENYQKVVKNTNLEHITDEDWGFYVEIDPPTPPKHVFPRKNKNASQPHLATPPSHYNEKTQQKNVNYLPQIQEEYNTDDDEPDQFILDLDLPHDHSNYKTYGYKEKISQNIFSGLTICALTTVSIYFYNKIRSC